MADNSGGRQQSLAEHEYEMQRQIMSVPSGSVPGPPQPPPVASVITTVMTSVMPPTLSIPPPPMPPPSTVPTGHPVMPPHGALANIHPPQQNLPPPGASSNIIQKSGVALNIPPPPSTPQNISQASGVSLNVPPPPSTPQNIGPPQIVPSSIAPPHVNQSSITSSSTPVGLAAPVGMAPVSGVAGIPPPPIRHPTVSLPSLGPSLSTPPPASSRGVLSVQAPLPVVPPSMLPPRSVATQPTPGPPLTPTSSIHMSKTVQEINTHSIAPSPAAPAPSTATMPPSSSVPMTNVNVATPGTDAQLPTSEASMSAAGASNLQAWTGAAKSKSEEENNDLKGSDDDSEQKTQPTEVILPKALEDVLALKDQRAAQFEGDIFIVEEEKLPVPISSGVISTEYADADGDSEDDTDMPVNEGAVDKLPVQGKLNKNKRKKKRRKQSRKLRQDVENNSEKLSSHDVEKGLDAKKQQRKEDDVTIEYIPERITIADLAPMYRQFYRVFEIFKLENKPKPSEIDKTGSANETHAQQKKLDEKIMDEDDDDPEEEKKDDKERLSKRKLKKLTRLSVAELKQLVNRPDVVEMHDVTARDPKLLVQLKAHRNTVQVPRHWCFKRKYLQGKRGIEKPPFDLPAFIKKTGIMEMRESLQEKDEAKSLKAKMRERARPKMGKIDIDYQKLHDAFFKWQTKPRMTIHGDLYYEGKEFETRLKEKKPGDLSEELRIALGMPVGPNCHKIPPPWLIAQQRYGPPPSYPNLKIPGLNAPIPDGTSFGYHAGGWGKPPVDENGKPLYGDVFGTNIVDIDSGVDEGDIERNTWGELESESEESSEEEESEGEDLVNAPDETGLVTPAEGLVTPSGLTSVPAGMETPDNIELRKRKIEAEMEDNETPVLYQVLPEKRADRIGVSMMGSTHVYDIGAVKTAAMNVASAVRQPAIGDREGMVELALDPSELDMDNDAMAQRYEQQMREQQSHLQKEDLSDMLAEHVARQKSKRKRQQADTSKQTKKYKEFKF